MNLRKMVREIRLDYLKNGVPYPGKITRKPAETKPHYRDMDEEGCVTCKKPVVVIYEPSLKQVLVCDGVIVGAYKRCDDHIRPFEGE